MEAKRDEDAVASTPSPPPGMDYTLPGQTDAIGFYFSSHGSYRGQFESVDEFSAMLRETTLPDLATTAFDAPDQPREPEFQYSTLNGIHYGTANSVEGAVAMLRASLQSGHPENGFATSDQPHDIVSCLDNEDDELKTNVPNVEAQPSAATRNLAVCNEEVLRSKFIEDDHFTNSVIARISDIAANVGERENLYGLLYSEKHGVYYCIHEACEKGNLSCQALHPYQFGCPVRGANCGFMMKVVTVGLERKFRVFCPSDPFHDIPEGEI
ncbi:hypothetical protein HG530_008634 [Fusarium avenaceum]|nr:hypothetical protein HG530_008634 [Fusarium avenaceum]